MKALPALALGVAVSAAAAVHNEDGSVLLTSEEVQNTIQYIREIQAVAIVNQQRVVQLENQVKLLKNTRCM